MAIVIAFSLLGTSVLGVLQDRTAVAAPSVWSITPSPNPGDSGDALPGVSCTSSTNCVAVGWYNIASLGAGTLVESWNGSAWSVTSSPVDGGKLNGVSCVSASDCVAVGSNVNTSGVSQTLIESWNGTAWSVVLSPTPTVVALFAYGFRPGRLILNQYGKNLYGDQVRNRFISDSVVDHFKSLGMSWTYHQLRHWFATNLLCADQRPSVRSTNARACFGRDDPVVYPTHPAGALQIVRQLSA